MKSFSSREIFKLLKKDGWYIVRTIGDHYQMKHPIKKRISYSKTSSKRYANRQFKKY